MRIHRTVILAGGILLAFLAFAFNYQVTSGDESRVAGIAAAMALSGDCLVPRLNGVPFLEYPSGGYLLMAASFKLFGITDFAAKLPAMLAYIGSALLLYETALNCRIRKRTALLSALFLLFMPGFWHNAANCRVDMLLAFFVMLAFRGWSCNVKHNTLKGWLAFTLGMTGGFFVKGPIGFGIPLAAAGVWQVVSDIQQKHFSWKNYLGFAAALAAVILCAGLYIAQLGKEEADALLVTNGIGRFSGAQNDHASPWYWYFTRGEFLQPYLIFTLGGLWFFFRRRPFRKGELFLVCALLVPFAALCLASAKRSVYLLPLCAPGAVIAAAMVARCWRFLRRSRLWNWKFTPGFSLDVASGGVIILITAGIFSAAKTENLRSLFEEFSRLEKSGAKICLYQVPERTSGAAVFYLKHTVPEVKDDPEGFDYAVIRNKRIAGKKYGDFHLLLPVSELKKQRRTITVKEKEVKK